MALFLDPIKSTALVVYAPQQNLFAQSKAYLKILQNIFMERSFKAQFADHRHFHKPIRVSIPAPQFTVSTPQVFNGTCKECLGFIKDTVHRTIDNMDYDGLKPYLKIIDLMEKKEKTIDEWQIDVENEDLGSTCVGMSVALLKNIQKEHGIQGTFAVEVNEQNEFSHAAVIIECTNGLVFVDNRSAPKMRLFCIPFGTSFEGKGFSITASPKGTLPPLIINGPHVSYKYYTHIANGADLVMKQFIFDTITKRIPIAMYNEDGSSSKDIIFKIAESKVRLMDYKTQVKTYIPFELVRQGDILSELKTFMGLDFHMTPETVHNEMIKFVFQIDRIIKLFAHIRN